MNIYRSTNNHKELLVIFAGFAGHFSHFVPFVPKTLDWICISDYRCLDLESLKEVFELFAYYKKISIIAFSMGVWVANKAIVKWDAESQITQKIAINGTEFGIDKQYGIPPKLFALTLKRFDLKVFLQNLFLGEIPKDYVFLQEKELKEELKSLLNHQSSLQKSLIWDKVIISKNDLIFSSQNQIRFWSDFYPHKTQIISLDAPHFAFFHLQDLFRGL